MEELTRQWPILVALGGVISTLSITIYKLFEQIVDKAEQREEAAIALARDSSRVLGQMTDRLEASDERTFEAVRENGRAIERLTQRVEEYLRESRRGASS